MPAELDDYGVQGRSEWRDIDWRQHQKWVVVSGRAINVIEMGEGDPPILFVHGLSGSWQNWLENIPHFARKHRVVTLDLPGFGESQMPSEDISIPGYGRCLDAVCDELGLDSSVVVGNSMGGFISAEMAIQFPHRVDRLVLVSAAGISSNDVKRDPTRVIERVIGFIGATAAARNERIIRRPRLVNQTAKFVMAHPERLSRELIWENMKGSGKPGFLPALDAILSYDLRDRLEEISQPTLVVWGEKDHLVPPRDARRYTETIANSRLVMMKDTGHVPQLERPARFNRVVEEFLAEEHPAGEGEEPAEKAA
jgi:pimeloyl-ACP methyl ester carboxylesterase